MLTKAQIQRIAQRNGIGMQVQERDYMQHLLLWLLYSRGQDLIYKGGTALRMVYGGNRYSEDLDFNGQDDVAVLQSSWKELVARLRDFGVQAEMRREWESEVGYSFDISFQGPLYDGRVGERPAPRHGAPGVGVAAGVAAPQDCGQEYAIGIRIAGIADAVVVPI
jgi:hypothetical protein